MITYVDSQSASTFDELHVVPKPSGVVEGDLLLATTQVLPADNGIVYPNEVTQVPVGWTQVAHTDWEEDTASHRRFWIRLFKKVAGASEPADYTFGLADPDTDGREVTMAAYRGCDPTTPIEAVSSSVTNAEDLPTTTLIIPSVTTLDANRLLVIEFFRAISFGVATFDPPTWVQHTGHGVLCTIHDKQQVSAGASGDQTATHISMTRGAFLVALVPADAIPGYRFDCSTIDSQIN
jgi:hypothetical protein